MSVSISPCYTLYVDAFAHSTTLPVMMKSELMLIHVAVNKGPCDRLRDTGTPSGRKRKILESSSYDT